MTDEDVAGEGKEVSALRRSSGEPSLDGGPRLRSDRTEMEVPNSKLRSVNKTQCSKKARPVLGPTDRVHGGRNREVQIVRYPRRKLFNRERKTRFLQWFAATSNLGWAAEVAGVARQTVSKHLQSDPEFRAGYDEALQVSLLRLKAKTMETRKPEAPLSHEGEIDAPDIDMPIDQALAVIREQEREVRIGRRQGAMPRVASNEELLKALTKRVKVLAQRVRRRQGLA